MPRKPCYWTRALELELVNFVREREFIWKPVGNTNHQIKQKYKAYAEFAFKLGPGFTARSVRDRWVNIRSTYNHNARRVRRSQLGARAAGDVFSPCWPLWHAMQFLAGADQHEYETHPLHSDFKELNNVQVKEELTEIDPSNVPIPEYMLPIRQKGIRTNRPRRKSVLVKKNNDKCKQIIEDLTKAMKPLVTTNVSVTDQQYWFFGRHVTERLNCMRDVDAVSASDEIMKILEDYRACGD